MPEVRYERFLALCSKLTGQEKFTLETTGVAETYLAFLDTMVSANRVDAILVIFADIQHQTNNPTEQNEFIQARLLCSPEYGDVLRNLIRIWYTATWNPMPNDWVAQYGDGKPNQQLVVSEQAYKQGLVWQAIQAHPPGAKQPGFGSWSHPPAQIPTQNRYGD